MKRQIAGLNAADRCADQVPDGIFLVRVQKAAFRRQTQKPYYTVNMLILEPRRFADQVISSRLYCTPRTLWKLNWFLRDFGYDAELLAKNEIDDKALIDLWGVVKVSEVTVHGVSILNFDGFAPAGRWEELSVFTDSDQPGSEVSS